VTHFEDLASLHSVDIVNATSNAGTCPHCEETFVAAIMAPAEVLVFAPREA
jgi:hypothetical protein